jgi:hypothetical protein
VNIRVYKPDGSFYRDVDNLRDNVDEFMTIAVGDRLIDAIGGPGEAEKIYRRTDEIEDGRVVFR